MVRKRARRDGECVYKKGRVRFFGGWERSLLHDIDEEELIMEILNERVRQNKPVGDINTYREIDGYTIEFTQKQSRALLLHVRESSDIISR